MDSEPGTLAGVLQRGLVQDSQGEAFCTPQPLQASHFAVSRGRWGPGISDMGSFPTALPTTD